MNRDLAIDANVSTTGITSATKTRPTKVFADGLTRVCVFDAALVLYGLWPGWGADPLGYLPVNLCVLLSARSSMTHASDNIVKMSDTRGDTAFKRREECTDLADVRTFLTPAPR